MLSMNETVRTKRPYRSRGPLAVMCVVSAVRANGGPTNVKTIAAALADEGFVSVNVNIQKAVKMGLIQRVRPGIYVLPAADPA